ncbi:MAG: hypothetical protein HYV60_21565, partial [Planctomycetia bacterium]|nr:hypothetical protein [Planctomycetia bacterium]
MPLLFGDAIVLERMAKRCQLGTLPRVVDFTEWERTTDEFTQPTIINFSDDRSIDFAPGIVSELTGLASYRYIK